ncbi:hypothetical protein ACIBKY_44530 [Nonomuraea sp. NPDC050394]|uniref:hypothetical protein n=1 Tax=Nonomuraea sp. NPDC050394 TaxID=3364363 RepID=UPI003796B241
MVRAGRHAVRLGSGTGDRLRAYYRERGFAYRGDVAVTGAPGPRHEVGPITWVSRYKRPFEGGQRGTNSML